MSNGSPFDPNSFFDGSIEAGFDTKFIPVPAGEWEATVGEGDNDVRGQMSKADSPMLVVNFVVNDPDAVEATGRENPKVPMYIVLDTDEHGNLEKKAGKNIKLGRLLEALGMNSGQVNLANIKGAGPVRIVVEHSGDDPDNPLATVNRVAAL